MRSNPLLTSLRAAEAAGYPALLIVSAACLGLVVAPVALLGLTDAGWVLGLALLYLIVAVAVLVGAVGAALSDDGEPDAKAPARTAARPASERPRASLSFGPRRRASAAPAPVAHARAGSAARRAKARERRRRAHRT